MIDLDELRREVATRHNVLIGKDDPILVTVTMHELVIQRYVEILAAAQEDSHRTMNAALAAHLRESKEVGGRIITEASSFIAEKSKAAIEVAIADATTRIRADQEQAKANLQTVTMAKNVTVIAAAIAGAAAILALVVAVAIVLR